MGGVVLLLLLLLILMEIMCSLFSALSSTWWRLHEVIPSPLSQEFWPMFLYFMGGEEN